MADTSSKLGDYMLKGWILTNQPCKSPGCSVPLMRSPSSGTPVVHVCVNCDVTPSVARLQPTINTSASASSTDSNISRCSTPPTEISSVLSSPVFALPVDTEETRRRREQSDAASAEIGKRLLKGWAMLGEECPNTHCYGVPLVRPPKAGGEKDPRKECVICREIYIIELDWAGREHLVPAGQNTPQVNQHGSKPPQEAVLPPPTISYDAPAQVAASLNPIIASAPAIHLPSETALMPGNQPAHTLHESCLALQATLRALSAKLGALTQSELEINPPSIASTADAISKVTQALSHVRQLQWSENRAHAQRF